MALQAKCERCRIRFVWGRLVSVAAFGGENSFLKGTEVKLRETVCPKCGARPLQSTTHLSRLPIRYVKPRDVRHRIGRPRRGMIATGVILAIVVLMVGCHKSVCPVSPSRRARIREGIRLLYEGGAPAHHGELAPIPDEACVECHLRQHKE